MNTSAATQLRSGTRRGTPPARAGWGWREQGLDALPQLLGQEAVHETGHARQHSSGP
jgi:hypothetical protein